nr:unnamed protein product [Callosobruchus chinensis]
MENCKKRCSVAINTNRQNAINKEFWEVTYEQQRQFIFSSVKKIDKKRKTKDGDSRRSSTIVYYLKSDSGTDVNVCKKFFLAILGYQVHNDRIVRDVRHEECWQCESFDLHSKISKHEKANIHPDCDNCQKWKLHNEQAIEARKEYKIDASSTADTDSLCFSADLQKVIMLPRCDMFKEILFVPRIICFNESFVPLGKQSLKNKPVAAVWHEGVAGRSKSDIISAFYNFFLVHRDVREITIWLDNCAAQNKNWSLYCFFVYLINSSEVNLNLLKVKYLQTGHTFMSADSFHHQVEKSLKQTGKVLDFEDFMMCVKKSNNSKYFKETLPKPTVRLAPRGVDKDRKTKLLQTLPAIVQPNRLQFWKDLPVAEGPVTDSD